VVVALLLLCFTAASLQGQDDLAALPLELMESGKFHDAELSWRRLEAKYPRNASIHSGLAVALAQQDKFMEASAEYRKSLALEPHQPDVVFNLGVAEFKQGHFSAAIPEFESYEKSRPDDTRSALLLGMSRYGLREYAKAAPYLQKAVQSDPSNLELRTVRAQNCLWAHLYDCAMEEFKSILAANPDAVQAHMLLAEALDGMDKTPDAITELEEAERLSPNEPILHFELGYLYYKQRNYEKAKLELESEIKNDPGYAQAYLYLGDIALHSNEETVAEPLLKKAVDLQNESRLAYFDLGSIYADQGRNQEAISALQHAIALDPDQPDAHYRLARLYSTLGEKNKAAQEFAKTKQLHDAKDESLIQKVSGEGPPPSEVPKSQ
jgi:tetratricopeptide (TPR) repeat protein